MSRQERDARYYRRHKDAIIPKRSKYQAERRNVDDEFRSRRREDDAEWREAFKAAMRDAGYYGRGDGLSPEGYRYREKKGLDVPPWPTLRDPRKARR